MTDNNEAAAGERYPWLPTEPAGQAGTNALIDPKQAHIINKARQRVADSKPAGPRWSLRASKQDAEQVKRLRNELQIEQDTKDPDREPFGGLGNNVYGPSLTAVELLSRFGTVDHAVSTDIRNGHTNTAWFTFLSMMFLSLLLAISFGVGNPTVGVLIFLCGSVFAITIGLVDARFEHRARIRAAIGPTLAVESTGVKVNHFDFGRNQNIARLMRQVHEVADGWNDPIWSFYTEITTVADEAQHNLDDEVLDADKAAVYNDKIAALADNLTGMINDRKQRAADAEVQRLERRRAELSEHPTNGENADELAARLDEQIRSARQNRDDFTT
jgi:hypothetical protein